MAEAVSVDLSQIRRTYAYLLLPDPETMNRKSAASKKKSRTR